MGERKRRAEAIGNMPIEQRHHFMLNAVANHLDGVFNGEAKGDAKQVGFVLLVFPLAGHEGRCNYISNANRKDVIVMLKEQLAYFEGQAEVKSEAVN